VAEVGTERQTAGMFEPTESSVAAEPDRVIVVDRAERVKGAPSVGADLSEDVDADVGYFQQLAESLSDVSKMDEDVLGVWILLDERAMRLTCVHVFMSPSIKSAGSRERRRRSTDENSHQPWAPQHAEVCRRSAVVVPTDGYRAIRRTLVRCGPASVGLARNRVIPGR
jgi:hypothetical protein